MTDYADLEISLSRRDADMFAVEMRFSQPDDQADRPPERGEADFNFRELRTHVLDPEAYGRALTASLFENPDLRSFLEKTQALVQSAGQRLRLRLLIDRSAPELNNLHWETLRNLQDEGFLAMDENLLFSRFLHSYDWSPVRLRTKGDLRALVVIANPRDLEDDIYEVDGRSLAPVDVEGELSRARDAMKDIKVIEDLVSDPEQPGLVSMDNLLARLRDGYDILYLVCHGALLRRDNQDLHSPREPHLWLEKEDGTADVAAGERLVQRIRDMSTPLRPRLIVLASCQSAGKGASSSADQGALVGLGPRLAQAGVPAVLAMQGNVFMETVAEFMPLFFEELSKDGHLDRAMAAARGAVRERPDWWVPVLFLRLRGGRFWYSPGFSGKQDDFEKWESLTSFIQEGICTVILGQGIFESLLGTRREMALRWAEKHGFPLSPHDREDLPSVAQYLSIRQDPTYLRIAFRAALHDELIRRHAGLLPEEMRQAKKWNASQTLQALQNVADQYWDGDALSPYQKLARLKLPIYINANPGDLLTNALIEAGAKPQIRLCPWNNMIPTSKSIYEDEPTPQEPLVYHLFGHLSEPFSLVMTEDEYFDFLIGVTVNKELIPSSVRAALSSSALLFLGFHMDDWQFRVFFRMVMAQEGKERLSLFSHAAAQIEPEEGRVLDAERARRYLEKYFEGEKISLYWGSSEDFLNALWQHMDEV